MRTVKTLRGGNKPKKLAKIWIFHVLLHFYVIIFFVLEGGGRFFRVPQGGEPPFPPLCACMGTRLLFFTVA